VVEQRACERSVETLVREMLASPPRVVGFFGRDVEYGAWLGSAAGSDRAKGGRAASVRAISRDPGEVGRDATTVVEEVALTLGVGSP
jgi:hypothetical protein